MTFTLNQTLQDTHDIFLWSHSNLNQIRKCTMSQNMHSFSNHFRDRYYIDIYSLTRATLMSQSWEGRNTCLWIYCKKMYILRPEKFFFHLYVSVVVCWINFQSRHLQAYYKCGISVLWRRHVPTGNRFVP